MSAKTTYEKRNKLKGNHRFTNLLEKYFSKKK